MKCLLCGTVFSEAHGTRMIGHLVYHKNKNVEPCKGKIGEVAMEQYHELQIRKNSQTAGKKHALEIQCFLSQSCSLLLSRYYCHQEIFSPQLLHQSISNNYDIWIPTTIPEWYLLQQWCEVGNGNCQFFIVKIFQTLTCVIKSLKHVLFQVSSIPQLAKKWWWVNFIF